MKCICTHACICRGVLVLPDTVMDLTEDELKAGNVDASFAKCGQKTPAPASEEDKQDASGMTKETYRTKLDQLGIPYDLTESLEDLAKKFRKATSTQTRKAVK